MTPSLEIAKNHPIDQSDQGQPASTKRQRVEETNQSSPTKSTTSKKTPEWVEKFNESWGEPLDVPEWKDDGGTYRQENGWLGRDLIHDVNSPVRISKYRIRYGTEAPLTGFGQGGVGTQLTGVVEFTPRAESHAGFCHGGSMTSVMDDVVGWLGFLVTGECKPWSGYTVQINTALKRPIAVNTTLMVQATIVKVDRRKVSITAELVDPIIVESADDNGSVTSLSNDSVAHATCEGLVILNKDVLGKGTLARYVSMEA